MGREPLQSAILKSFQAYILKVGGGGRVNNSRLVQALTPPRRRLSCSTRTGRFYSFVFDCASFAAMNARISADMSSTRYNRGAERAVM
jgi:hypothetical protein